MRDLVWLPESLGERLAGALRTRLNDWSAAWGVPAAGPIEVRRLEAWASLPEGFTDLLEPPPADWRQALTQALFKQAAADSAIVEGVLRRVLDGLQAALPASPPPEVSVLAPASAPGQLPTRGPGHCGVLVTVQLLGRRCGFALGLQALRTGGWLLRPGPRPLDAINPERACAHLSVPLIAELGHASLSVSDLLQLGEGDVLILRESLDAPLRVGSPGSTLSLNADLGATPTSRHRAARWVSS